MRISKEVSRLFWLTVLCGTALNACTLPKPESRVTADGSATFYVDQANGELRADQEIDAYSLPKSRTYNFSVCVRDSARSKAIQNQEFQVEEIGQTAKTDLDGCLNWTEKVNFNFLAQSQYIQLTRHLVAQGLHRGKREIDFAINPWSHGENLPQVLDLSKSTLPHVVSDARNIDLALHGLSADHQVKTRPIWIEDGRLFVTEQKFTDKGVNLFVEARVNPSIKLTTMSGDVTYRQFTTGTFRSRLRMIHSYIQNNKEIHRELARSDWMTTRMEGGYLSIQSPIQLSAIPTRGQIVLALEVYPINGPPGLEGFEGIYLAGEYDQIKSNAFLKVRSEVAQSRNFRVDDYVNARVDDRTALNSDVYQQPKIEVAPLEFRFIRVGRETTSTREVFYNIKACVRNGIEQKAVRAHTFKITRFRQSESEPAQVSEIKTDNNACINWDESMTFKYFDCQRFFKGFIMIENADLGLKQKLEIAVNPWESWSSIARDMRYSDPSDQITLECKEENRLRTRVMMDSFSYNTLSYDYAIDDTLNLTVRKKIQFKLEPKLLIYNSLGGGRSDIDRLRDGVYLFKALVVQNKDYDAGNTYVTHFEKIVNVMNGQINTDMEFAVDDLRALGNRNNILIAVYPVDEKKLAAAGDHLPADLDSLIDNNTGLEITPYIGPVVLNSDDQSSRPLRPLDQSQMADYFAKGQIPVEKNGDFMNLVIQQGLQTRLRREQERREAADKSRLASASNMELMNLTDDSSADLRRALALDSRRFYLIGGLSPTPDFYREALDKTPAQDAPELNALVGGGALNKATAQKLCLYWFDSFMQKNMSLNPYMYRELSFECQRQVQEDPAKFFLTERRLLVHHLDGFQYLRGLNHGLSVGTSFSLSNSHNESRSRTLSLSAQTGLSYKFFDIFSIGVSGSYGLSWATSDSQGSSNSLSVGESTSLSVQQNLFQLRVGRYEQCVALRLNPLLFVKDTTSAWYNRRRDFIDTLNRDLSDEEKARAATRAILLCSGQEQNQPTSFTESYYLINQDTASNQIQDAGDVRNRNFFLALRGERDYQRFLTAIRSASGIPGESGKEAAALENQTDFMVELFRLGSPNAPGSLLLLN